MTTLKTASVLAFERKLDISDAFFYQEDSKNEKKSRQVVSVIEKSVRGTISNRLKSTVASNPVKLDAEVQKANLQKIDTSSLDAEYDTLVVNWSCKILPFNGEPNVCNNQEYRAALSSVVDGYLHEHGLSELARRYAINIANARWLWRNRVGAESISVTVHFNDERIVFDDAKAYSLTSMAVTDDKLNKLSQIIEQGLLGHAFTILYIEAKAVVGYGQEVFPSQEMVLDTGKTKSKELYQVNNKAGMHSQKIGNAIRTIDNWYLDADFPIAVETYGAVTTMGTAFRPPKKKDFYNLFDNWVIKGEKPEIEQQHYVMAVLIRGGVFGESGKE